MKTINKVCHCGHEDDFFACVCNQSFSKTAAKTNKQDVGGEELANNGIRAAMSNVSKEWREDAMKKLEDLLRAKEFVTADDLHLVGHRHAIGGIFRWASSEELCEFSGVFAKSTNPTRHAGMVRVWKSLIFQK